MNKQGRLFVAFTAVFAVTGVTFAFGQKFSGKKERTLLAAKLAQARAIGLSTDPEEVWGPRIPDADNAAVLLNKIDDSKEEGLARASEELDRLGTKPSTSSDRILLKALTRLEPQIRLFEEASSLPKLRFDESQRDDPWVSPVNLSMILARRARYEARQGDVDKAFRTLGSISRMGRLFGSQPSILGKLLQVLLENSALDGGLYILNDGGQKPGVRAAFRDLVRRLGPIPNYKECVRVEWLRLRRYMDALEAGKTELDGQPLISGDDRRENTILQVPYLRLRQDMEMVDIYSELYKALPDDPTRTADVHRAVDRFYARCFSGVFETTLAQAFLPDYRTSIQSFGCQLGRRRAVLALLNALDRPVPPTSLPAKGAEALDPLDGKPLRYLAKDGTITVWGGTDKPAKGLPTGDYREYRAVWPWPELRPML